jgi:hypothetical protein
MPKHHAIEPYRWSGDKASYILKHDTIIKKKHYINTPCGFLFLGGEARKTDTQTVIPLS